jgi:hypothetical protein
MRHLIEVMQAICGSFPARSPGLVQNERSRHSFYPGCGPNLGIGVVADDLDPQVAVIGVERSRRVGGAAKAGNNGY